ncbi:DUF975 domain-containing protein [Nostocaceae cyanobacterium CENA369]|uniref:DUF975 domain-containing protein n=1 Tax=Dendronalium phyllosphericum CENA369 TaxID=1725256 RepID=A0A8J7IE59_9NOST|nr:DUF975 domain-containing protein [Dendronalium phyllosphericum]MBH8576935.1 DUF975 domain-containing protein [Dendronalium phyllosphericum CENA369]
MSQNLNPQNPMQPLSLGNVVTAGFRLYRSHLKSYFLLALTVSLWSLLPFLFFIPAGILLYLNRFNNNSPLIWLIFVVIGIGLYLYALGKSSVNAATISRLAFSELINQPETVNAAHSHVKPRLWIFVVTIILLFLIFLGVFLVFTILMILPLLNLLIFLPALAAIFWFMARFFITDVLIAIEDNLDSVKTISRSWDLSKGNAWRIVLIFLVAGLITIPLQLVVQLISRGILQPLIQPLISEAINGSTNAIFFIAGGYLLILLVSFLFNAIILPFWQAIKAVIYYDLRSRREGLGLQLRDREI